MLSTPDDERKRILARFRGLRRDIELDLNSAAIWNENTRQLDEEPLDADPFGELR